MASTPLSYDILLCENELRLSRRSSTDLAVGLVAVDPFIITLENKRLSNLSSSGRILYRRIIRPCAGGQGSTGKLIKSGVCGHTCDNRMYSDWSSALVVISQG